MATAGFGQLGPLSQGRKLSLPNPSPTALQHCQGAQENTQGGGTETH